MDERDKISVIIPVFNRKKELKRAVESVLKQTHSNFEIIVADDFSDDNPHELINEINDARIRCVRLPKKSNANVARNAAIKIASGKYIALLDSDDEFLPHHLERKIKIINEWKCDGIFGSAKIFDGQSYRYKPTRSLKENEKMIDYLLTDGFAPTPTQFFRSDAIKEILFDEQLNRHQDYDFSVRFSEKYKFLPDNEVTVIIHWHRNEKRNIDWQSQVKFIEKYKNDISPSVYNHYHMVNYHRVKSSNGPEKIIRHYETNASKYIKQMSISDYFSIYMPKNKFQKIFLRLKFLVKVLLS